MLYNIIEMFHCIVDVVEYRYTEKMGRLSEDIMAMFGVKPSNQQSSVKDPAVSDAPNGVFNCSWLFTAVK